MRSLLFLILFLLPGTTAISQQALGLNGLWKFNIGDKSSWSNPKYDDSEWESIQAPAHWEDEGFNGYDGFAWYRKKFDGRRLTTDQNYVLHLGFIDDADEVFLNGKLIGLSGSMPPEFKTAYNHERKYAIPSDIINFNGENVIAVRVFDVTQAGGIVDGRLGIFEVPRSRMIVDLQGLWSFTTVPSEQPVKSDAEWKKIMVPGMWDHQGYNKYDGFAWYKRSFRIPDNVLDKDDDLVLMLGKIDDFDKVYLNGKLIGKTNDGRPLGDSWSYNQLRVYDLPVNLMKKGADNIIEVLVEDIGRYGGIYEGPVGIATRTSFERYFR